MACKCEFWCRPRIWHHRSWLSNAHGFIVKCDTVPAYCSDELIGCLFCQFYAENVNNNSYFTVVQIPFISSRAPYNSFIMIILMMLHSMCHLRILLVLLNVFMWRMLTIAIVTICLLLRIVNHWKISCSGIVTSDDEGIHKNRNVDLYVSISKFKFILCEWIIAMSTVHECVTFSSMHLR